MRPGTFFFNAACFTALFAVLLIAPMVKASVDYIVTTVGLVSIGNLLLYCLPVYIRCRIHEHATYKTRWSHAGKSIRCPHCGGQCIQVPQITCSQVAKQLFQRFILRKPARQVAFVCQPIAIHDGK